MSFINDLKNNLNKKLKDEVAFLIADNKTSFSDVKTWIPTGCSELDMIISNNEMGGIPVGKVTEIAGLESTGKSLMAMQIMANAQKMGALCVYIDTEQGLNTEFASRVGLDPWADSFVHIKSTTVENVFTTANDIGAAIYEERKKAKKEKRKPEFEFVVFVWDSVAATYTKTDLENENPDPGASIAVKARILSKNMPFIVQQAEAYDFAFVCINQLRQIVNAMPAQDPWVSPGGKAIPYYASVRLRIQSIGKMKDNKDGSIYGIKTRVKIMKTRFGPPFRIAEFPIYFTYGIDNEESMVNVLEGGKKISKIKGGQKGNLYHFKDDSKDSAINLIELKNKIRTDKDVSEKVKKMMAECLVKDMVDPRNMNLEVVTDLQLETEM